MYSKMKSFLYLFLLLFSAIGFAQNTGMIVGKIMDKELNDSPLVLANVSVKGTSITADTDLTGLFVIENLKAGDYTLECSFVGYESKEIEVHVDATQPAEVNLSLAASTVSSEELAMLSSLAQKETASMSAELN